MPLVRWHNRTFTPGALFLLTTATLSFAQNSQKVEYPTPAQRHFDHVLIVVLENQNYESAIGSDLLKKLSLKGAVLSNFGNLYHHSYPNYLAMIAGSDFDTHTRLNSDVQVDFKEDNEHRTIADVLNWRNYFEDYGSTQPLQRLAYDRMQFRYSEPHHEQSGDGTASVITGIWK